MGSELPSLEPRLRTSRNYSRSDCIEGPCLPFSRLRFHFWLKWGDRNRWKSRTLKSNEAQISWFIVIKTNKRALNQERNQGQRSNPDAPSSTFCFFELRHPEVALKRGRDSGPTDPTAERKVDPGGRPTRWDGMEPSSKRGSFEFKTKWLKKKTTLCRFTKHVEEANRVRVKRKASNEENLAFRVGVSSHNPSVLDQCCRLLPWIFWINTNLNKSPFLICKSHNGAALLTLLAARYFLLKGKSSRLIGSSVSLDAPLWCRHLE